MSLIDFLTEYGEAVEEAKEQLKAVKKAQRRMPKTCGR